LFTRIARQPIQRRVFDYNFPNNVALELKPKKREVQGKSDKDMAKYNTKKNQKLFMDVLAKQCTSLGPTPFLA